MSGGFARAQREALVQGLRLLEAYIATPIGLHHDLEALREGLAPGLGPLRERPSLSPRQAWDLLSLVEGSARLLRGLDAVEEGWLRRAEKVLARCRHRLGSDLRRPLAQRVRGLYVIVDPSATSGRPVEEVALAALRGGAGVIQLRDKRGEKGDLLPLALRLREACEAHGALFIVNDHPDLARASGAHGVHLGQHDLPPQEARPLLGPEQLVGRSHATLEEALESQALGVDYIAVGAMFPTTSKEPERTRHAGPETLRQVKQSVSAPVVAVGGITPDNVAQVVKAGADAVAVIRAVCSAPDPESAARLLVERIRQAQEG